MKKLFLLLLLTPVFCLSQNFVFFGDNSYPSSDTITLNSQEKISFIKFGDSISIYFQASYILAYEEPQISRKFNIYLDDGSVITSIKADLYDYVNKDCISIYPLTDDDVSKLTMSNVNSIRYSIDKRNGYEQRIAKNTHYRTTDLIKSIL